MNILFISLLIIGIIMTSIVVCYLTIIGVINYLTEDFWEELTGRKSK